MTQLLQQALTELQRLSASEQDTVAALILEEIADERRWKEAFARSPDKLARLAAKVREDIRRPSLEEAEQERLRLAGELAAESGERWAEEYLPGTTGCHELLDRTSLVSDLLERHILEHPACVANPVWYRLAEQAADALCELYQQVCAEHLGREAAAGSESTDVPA